jgi:hypothetical protein
MVCYSLSVSALIFTFRSFEAMMKNFSFNSFYKLYKRIPNYLEKALQVQLQNWF